MNRDQALALLESRTVQDNILKHSLASEAVMRALAKRLDHDQNTWGITGLLHDLDYEQTKEDMTRHGLVSADILQGLGLDAEIINAIKAHNAESLGLIRLHPLDFALTAGETITGLIIAVTLVYPDKRLKSVKPSSIIKRMKETHFARSVNRDHIMLCERLGLELPEFVTICLSAMADIDKELGLG